MRSPRAAARGKPLCSNKDPAQSKINKQIYSHVEGRNAPQYRLSLSLPSLSHAKVDGTELLIYMQFNVFLNSALSPAFSSFGAY